MGVRMDQRVFVLTWSWHAVHCSELYLYLTCLLCPYAPTCTWHVCWHRRSRPSCRPHGKPSQTYRDPSRPEFHHQSWDIIITSSQIFRNPYHIWLLFEIPRPKEPVAVACSDLYSRGWKAGTRSRCPWKSGWLACSEGSPSLLFQAMRWSTLKYWSFKE